VALALRVVKHFNIMGF